MTDPGSVKSELDRLKSAVNELTILNDLALAASLSLEVDKVLDTIVEKTRKAVNAEQGSILLVTSKSDAPLQTLIRQADQSQIMTGYKVGIPISGWVLKYRQPLIIADLSKDERFKVNPEEARHIRTVLCVPIMFKSELLGVLIMANKKSGGAFTKDDLRLLTIMAAQSGQLIRNSQLQNELIEKKRLEYELELARDIQKKLLPEKPPRYQGIEIAACFRPHVSVSGDYYDFIPLNNNRLGIIAADVSGHGPSAALVMTLVKGITHTVLTDHEDPGEALHQINRTCSKILPADMFVTMIYCVVNISGNSVILANAGHNPLLYYDHMHTAIRLEEATGCALNVLPEVHYQERHLDVSAGDILFLYTDGLTEATDLNQQMFGIDRLTELIRMYHNNPAQIIVEKIYEALVAHEGDGESSDDVLMIALRFPE